MWEGKRARKGKSKEREGKREGEAKVRITQVRRQKKKEKNTSVSSCDVTHLGDIVVSEDIDCRVDFVDREAYPGARSRKRDIISRQRDLFSQPLILRYDRNIS